jgi:hypothetical protein
MAHFLRLRRKKPGFPLQLLALPRCGVSAAIPCAPKGFRDFEQALTQKQKLTTDVTDKHG